MNMQDLRKYLSIALKWWWLLILTPIVTATIGYIISHREAPIYRASTTIIVGQTIQSVNPNAGDFALSAQLAQTYADMARRQPVLQGVVESLGLDINWRKLKERVRVRPVSGTQLLEITVETTSPEMAQQIADEVAHQLILLSPTNLQNQEQSENQRRIREQIANLQAKIKTGQERLNALEAEMNTALSAEQWQKLQSEIETLKSSISAWEANYTELLIFIESKKSANYLAIIEPAQLGRQIGPRVVGNTFLAGVIGLFLAVGIIFPVEYLDDTIKSSNDLNKSLGLITLGTISRMGGKEYQKKLIIAQGPFSPVSEAYRMIRSNIQFMSVDQPIKSIMVTSSTAGEGKSVTVANLGIIMAQAGLKTIIVDSDLRRPTQHEIFQIPNHRGGLTELLCSPEIEIKNQLRDTKVENLRVLTSGVLPPNPAELLGSQRMGQLLTKLNELADIVVYDSPPVLAVTDAPVLSNRVDGVVLVILAGRARYEMIKQALLSLRQANANVLGGVLNRVPKKRGYYGGYYYYTSKMHPTSAGQSTNFASKRRWQWLPFFK